MSSSDKHGARARLKAANRAPSQLLQKVQRGEMSIDDYLDEVTEAALSRVQGRVVGDALANLRETMREHLRTDPTMVELIRQMTGQAPDPGFDGPKS